MSASAKNLLWVDFETSGLNGVDPNSVPVEIVAVVTDAELNVLDVLGPFSINPLGNALPLEMSPWSLETFMENGLLERCMTASDYTSLEELDQDLSAFIERHFPAKGQHGFRGANLAGASVHYDLGVLVAHFPAAAALVDYRVLDVSSLNCLAERANPELYRKAMEVPSGNHTALADITHTIGQAKLFWSALRPQA